MEDRGEVISIKFSYDMKVLAIQRSHKSVVSNHTYIMLLVQILRYNLF